MPTLEEMSRLAVAADDVTRLGDTPETQKNRARFLDTQWRQSGSNVVNFAKATQQTYEEALGTLSSPSVKLIPSDDPRVLANTMAKAQEIPGDIKVDQTGALHATQEKRAMTAFNNGREQDAMTALVQVAQKEQARVEARGQAPATKTKSDNVR